MSFGFDFSSTNDNDQDTFSNSFSDFWDKAKVGDNDDFSSSKLSGSHFDLDFTTKAANPPENDEAPENSWGCGFWGDSVENDCSGNNPEKKESSNSKVVSFAFPSKDEPEAYERNFVDPEMSSSYSLPDDSDVPHTEDSRAEDGSETELGISQASKNNQELKKVQIPVLEKSNFESSPFSKMDSVDSLPKGCSTKLFPVTPSRETISTEQDFKPNAFMGKSALKRDYPLSYENNPVAVKFERSHNQDHDKRQAPVAKSAVPLQFHGSGSKLDSKSQPNVEKVADDCFKSLLELIEHSSTQRASLNASSDKIIQNLRCVLQISKSVEQRLRQKRDDMFAAMKNVDRDVNV